MTAIVDLEAGPEGEVTVRPVQPTVGAEISGVDLRYPLSDGARHQIKAAVLQYKVVFFRDQDLDQDQHAAFAAQFGPLYAHPHVKQAYAEKVTGRHPRDFSRRCQGLRKGGWAARR